jgi:hypothetical protein
MTEQNDTPAADLLATYPAPVQAAMASQWALYSGQRGTPKQVEKILRTTPFLPRLLRARGYHQAQGWSLATGRPTLTSGVRPITVQVIRPSTQPLGPGLEAIAPTGCDYQAIADDHLGRHRGTVTVLVQDRFSGRVLARAAREG